MALSAPPTYDPIAAPEDQTDPRGKKLPKLAIGFEWLRYFTGVSVAVDEKPTRKAVVNRSLQGASIASIALPLGTIPPGVWRVSYIARITRPATTSSSLEVTIRWTAGGVAQSRTGAAEIGNLTTTHQFGTLIIRVDASTPISFATTYGSVGGTSMLYQIDLVAEQLALD